MTSSFRFLVTILGLLLALSLGCGSATRQPEVDADRPSAAEAAEIESLVEALRAATSTRADTGHALIELGRKTTPFLLPLLDDEKWQTRWHAVNVLGATRDERGLEGVLERALVDEEAHVRWRANWALQSIDSDRLPRLVEEELRSEDSLRRWNAAVVGSLFGVDASRGPLLEGLPEATGLQAQEAVSALGRLRGEGALEALLAKQAQAPPRLRREITMALGRFDEPRARVALEACLDDPDSGVRERARRLLGR